MKKSVLITGANGFVGANLTRKLVKDEYNVHICTRAESSLWRLQDIADKITIHSGVLSKKKELKILIKKISPFAIYHLAAYGAYPSQQDYNQMIETNIVYMGNLLESIKESTT